MSEFLSLPSVYPLKQPDILLVNQSKEQSTKILGVLLQDYKLFAFPIIENIVLNQKEERERLDRAIDLGSLIFF